MDTTTDGGGGEVRTIYCTPTIRPENDSHSSDPVEVRD